MVGKLTRPITVRDASVSFKACRRRREETLEPHKLSACILEIARPVSEPVGSEDG